jgi:hypothetical protein
MAAWLAQTEPFYHNHGAMRCYEMMMVKPPSPLPPCTPGQGNAYPRHGYNTDSTSMLLLTPERPHLHYVGT